MHVGRVMKKQLVTIPPTLSLNEAMAVIKEKNIDHLLVVDASDRLVGIVSDRDLKKSMASPATTLSKHELNYLLEQTQVDVIMVKRIIAITPDTTIERAARIMQQNNISCLPVMDHEKLVGIITTTDVMEVLLQAIGMETDSMRFTVLVKDRVGVMADICNLLRNNNINIRSLVTWPETEHPDLFQLIMRVPAKDGDEAMSILKQEGFKVLTEYVEDVAAYLG
jgi:acetoin utilization protein AcuB